MITPSLHPRYRARVGPQSYPIRSEPSRKLKACRPLASVMHWRRKLGIGMCFAFMPAMAPLWAIALGLEVNTTIRILTVLFIPGLLMALGSTSKPNNDPSSN